MRISDWSSDVCSSDLYPLPELQALAFQHGLAVLGVDSVDDPKSTLRTRMWYPLSATTQRIQAAADLWSNVSQNHDEHADPKDVSLARYLSFSLRAAGIRIRDASDQRSEEHTSELQSLMSISYAVSGLKK